MSDAVVMLVLVIAAYKLIGAFVSPRLAKDKDAAARMDAYQRGDQRKEFM